MPAPVVIYLRRLCRLCRTGMVSKTEVREFRATLKAYKIRRLCNDPSAPWCLRNAIDSFDGKPVRALRRICGLI